jgi:hypothetical protein
MLVWAALTAICFSFWQIFIPLYLFPLNFSQLCLGITSLFFLLISILVLKWSYTHEGIAKKEFTERKKLNDLNDEENQTNDKKPLPSSNLDYLLSYFDFASLQIEKSIYVISFVLIACYLVFLVGILIEEVLSVYSNSKGLFLESSCGERS